MKKSVKILVETKDKIKTRQMGEIAKDMATIFNDIFGTESARQLCDDLGSVLCDNVDLSDDEWVKQRIIMED